ncbi:MAG TPA: HEAT repeat domain-containing protein [Terriglobales bacterium]|jgi:HEAT repeat protein|nr:HEAT repeat domain-containing protein [Terriglobales bacterium]
MGSVSKGIEKLGAAGLVLEAILASLLGIFLLIGFIVLRRWYRGRYFQKRNERTVALRSQWNDILSGKIPAEDWRFKALDCDIVQSILLDSIETSPTDELPPLLDCLRVSGLLDMRIYEARTSRGLKQRTALLALGRTRAREAIPALAAGLDSNLRETRIAAVRGLGRTARMEAAIPILDRIVTGRFDAPERSLKNALVNCCRSYPEVLVNYVEQTQGPVRELLARVLGELASPSLGEELLVLASDVLPEVRASAARALGNTNSSYTLPALHTLAADPEWFVRLRAVVALGQIENVGKIRILLRSLCDANRHVRQRAAWALARMEPQLDQILEDVVATKDDYALQAFVSELERSGAVEKIVGGFAGAGRHSAESALMEVVAEARKRVELTGKAVAASAGSL